MIVWNNFISYKLKVKSGTQYVLQFCIHTGDLAELEHVLLWNFSMGSLLVLLFIRHRFDKSVGFLPLPASVRFILHAG